VELQSLFQIGEGLFFAFTLAGDIDFKTLRNIPVAFAPYCSGERSLHDRILSHNFNAFCHRNFLQILINSSERYAFTKGEIKVGGIVRTQIPPSGWRLEIHVGPQTARLPLIGSCFNRRRYSSICCSVILLRFLNETKMLFATSKAQISGTMASLVASNARIWRL
jgi:hypothetical protein